MNLTNKAIADTGDYRVVITITDADGRTVLCLWSDDERDFVNAHLMSAAPDLLAACKEAREYLYFDSRALDSDCVTHLEAAIAKAEGVEE